MRYRKLGLLLFALAAAAVVAGVAFAGAAPTVGPNEVQPTAGQEVNRAIPNSQSAAHVPSRFVPRPSTVAVSTPGSELATSFAGLNHYDQRNVADNGNQFSLEPPDQGLCAGNGFVIEPVNTVFAIYNTSGVRQGDITSLTTFFTGMHQINRNDQNATYNYGPFLSDPRCYYDPGTSRWFMTILEIGKDPTTGAFVGQSAELIAVSKSSTPSTDPSNWYIYSIDTTNNGGSANDTIDGNPSNDGRTLPTDAGCPCFGDQPLMGADQYGFYITTNEFSIFGPNFDQAQVYAFDKVGLESGTLKMQYVADAPTLAEGYSYSLQPATSPTTGDWSPANGGTEYMLSALDFNGTLDNRIAVWALTNTSSLATATPDVQLSAPDVISSEVYGQPPDAVQKSGPTPLATVIQQLYGAKNPKSSSAPQEELLAGNDDRMNQVVYAGGQLWGAVNTVVKTGNGPTHIGSAYFDVAPSVDGSGNVSGDMTAQGYVAVNQANLDFPSIAVTSGGKAVYTATLSGTNYYPSAVYATIDPSSGPSSVKIAGAGVGPDDGFTGYPPFGGPTGRWGDYSAAVPDGSGGAWVATEYIGQSCTNAEFYTDTTCGGTRTILANWGTYVAHVTP
jgi:hypothetical protein